MRYHHRFIVGAPLERVRDFHSRTESMAAITPPPTIVQVHRAPAAVSAGAEMEFTLWMGPLPLRWLARFDEVGPQGFVDRMVRGPFQKWEHRHTFVAVDAERTEVIDTLEIELSEERFWRAVGRVMTWSLPLLFGFRAWKTRRILEAAALPAPA